MSYTFMSARDMMVRSAGLNMARSGEPLENVMAIALAFDDAEDWCNFLFAFSNEYWRIISGGGYVG